MADYANANPPYEISPSTVRDPTVRDPRIAIVGTPPADIRASDDRSPGHERSECPSAAKLVGLHVPPRGQQCANQESRPGSLSIFRLQRAETSANSALRRE